MGTQTMLVNVQEDETRIALLESKTLVDLHIEQTSRERTVGNIYCGTVVKVNPAFQAAFIEYGESRNGFLSVSDISPTLYKGGDKQKGRPKIQSILKQGQTLMVQVVKEGMRDKGAALTTMVSLPGRYLVLAPNSDRSGVSRRIEEPSKRGQLKDVLQGLMGDDSNGVIIRTAGLDRTPAELKRDLSKLLKDWKAIEAGFKKSKKPRLLHHEPKSLLRVLRDYFTDEVEEVCLDSPQAYQEALTYFKTELPKFQKRLKLYVGDKSLFSAHRVEEQIIALDSSRVGLPSGGGIVIEPTEALVTIDVNSGRSNRASDIEDTALQTNLEAAAEVAKQLRLRNLGGLVVIDFIDMMQKRNREKVEKALAASMKADKARISLGHISEFGLMELSRQRIDVELSRGSRMRCDNCGGTGHVPTVNSRANSVLREIREMAASGRYSEIHGELPLEHANYLLNSRREALRDLELEFEIEVHLVGNPALPASQPVSLRGNREAPADEAGDEHHAEAGGDADGNVEAGAGNGAARPRAGHEGDESDRPRRRRRRGGRGRGRGDHAEQPAEFSGYMDAADEDEETAVEPVMVDDDEDEEFEQVAVGANGEEEDGEKDEDEWSPGNQIEEPVPVAVAAASHPGNGGTPPPTIPRTFTLPQAVHVPLPPGGYQTRRRGGFLQLMGDDTTPTGDTVYHSEHQPQVDSPHPIIHPTFQRSNPFIGNVAAEGEVLFISAHRGGNGGTAGDGAPEGGAEALPPAKRTPRGRGNRGGRGRSRAAGGKDAAATGRAESSAKAGGGNARPARGGSARGASGRGGRRKPQRKTTAGAS